MKEARAPERLSHTGEKPEESDASAEVQTF
jgi:hypothetical protein